MKHLVLTLALVASACAVKAQSLTFEETVTYIKELLVDSHTFFCPGDANTGYYIGGISASKSGKVVFKGSSNELSIGTFSLNDIDWTITDWLDGKLYLYQKDTGGNWVRIGMISALPKAESDRLLKAFQYLQTLCTEKDPFGS